MRLKCCDFSKNSIVLGIEENTGHQHFLLFLQKFSCFWTVKICDGLIYNQGKFLSRCLQIEFDAKYMEQRRSVPLVQIYKDAG